MGNNLLSAKATLPVYDRNNLAPRIVHLGFGAFHRAHQGVYADILATELRNISVTGDIMRSI